MTTMIVQSLASCFSFICSTLVQKLKAAAVVSLVPRPLQAFDNCQLSLHEESSYNTDMEKSPCTWWVCCKWMLCVFIITQRLSSTVASNESVTHNNLPTLLQCEENSDCMSNMVWLLQQYLCLSH